MKLSDLVGEPLVGEMYTVPCVKYFVKSNSGCDGGWRVVNYVPVLGDSHHDKETPFIGLHFHIDVRFYESELGTVVPAVDLSEEGLFDRELKCIRRMSDWTRLPRSVPNLGEDYRGSSCCEGWLSSLSS
jgi:hypothetical protein